MSKSVMASIKRVLTAAGSVVLFALTRVLRSCNKCSVAFTPVSANSKAVSSSSYKASSICVPVKTDAILPPVLRNPALSLLSHDWRGPSDGSGLTAALKGAACVAEELTSGVLTSAGAGLGAERKNRNIWSGV